MTYKELEPAIKILNERYIGKVMKPYELPIKEFVAASQFSGLFPQFRMAYAQAMGDANRALKTIEDQNSLMIYAVFNGGRVEGYGIEKYEFAAIQDFLQLNDVALHQA